MKLHLKNRLALTTALSLSALFAPAAFAQDATEASSQLDEVVVTADRTGARALQSTPIAVSVVSGELMARQGLATVADLSTYVPNLTVSRNISSSAITIRGIGSNGGSEPSVATQIDGVYLSNSVAFTEFFDIERSEVLRGPQGTLYGRNTTGGLINFISRKPSAEVGGRFQASYGNYGAIETQGYVTGPISGEELTASLAVTYRKRDPFFENIAPGGEDIDSTNSGGARAQLRWAPQDNIDSTLRIDYFKADQTFESYDHPLAAVPFSAPLANSLVGSFDKVAIDADQTYVMETGGISNEFNWDFADNWSFSSISAYRTFESTAFNDNDATELNLLYFRSTSDISQFSQELNLRYSGDRLKAVGGFYYFNSESEPGSRVVQPPSVYTPAAASAIRDVAPTLNTESIALFGNANLDLTSKLSLVLGMRYTAESTTIIQNFSATSLNPPTLGADRPGFPIRFRASRDDHAFTPKFGLNYQLNDDVFLFASATRGFKSGSFNGQATTAATAGYAPEYIWSYEGGAKTEWLDRRLRVNVTAFRYDYTDLQVRQLLGPGASVISNAASAIVDGVELEVIVRPKSDLQITLNGSLLDATYDSFKTAPIPGGFSPYVLNQNCVAGVCTVDASGNFLSDAPERSGLVAVDYTPQIGQWDLSLHADYSYRSERYFDVTNVAISRQDGYGLLNANVRLSPVGANWNVSVFGRNLTDEDYYQTIAGNGIVPGGIVGNPRTYGIRLGLEW